MHLEGSRYFSLDVETANPDTGSICQIGIGMFENGELTGTWKSYINPEDYFSHYNIRVHGIEPEVVRNSPKFYEVYSFLRKTFEHRIVIHHMPFDRIAFDRAYKKYRLEPFHVQWIDSAQVARKTWRQFSRSGYGLSNLANFLGIRFKHHDALEDSVTAGRIVTEACRELNVEISHWL